MQDCTTASSPRHSPDIPRALAEHEGLVRWVVHCQWLEEPPYAEALLGYDPTRGCAFSTYTVSAIQRAVWQAVDRARSHQQEVPMPDPPRPAPDLDQVAQQALVRQALYRPLARLP